MKYIKDLLVQYGVVEGVARNLSWFVIILLILMVCIIAQLICRKVILRFLTFYIKKNKFQWGYVMLNRKVFHRATFWVPAIIIYISAPFFSYYQDLIQRIVSGYVFVIGIFVMNVILVSINDIYKTKPISKLRPIKGFIQIVQIIIYIVMSIAIVANLIGKNPLGLLSSIGALTAVFSLVFKDTILGFIAGIQLTSNDMLRIGDCIQMPKYDADGNVIEILLSTVMVQNFDKTIVSVPAYALVSDSFVNWRGMSEAGGRRIKRSIHIDTASIQFCSEDMIDKFKKIHYIKEYMEQKCLEIDRYNTENNIDHELLVNGRHLTNLGTFRAYIENYLKHHSGIHNHMTQMVRQLAPGDKGVPLEIYMFTNDTNWVNYEKIQADIFDHLLAVVNDFELRIFQNPTGYDLRTTVNNLNKSQFL